MLTSHEIDDIADRLREWLSESNEELDHPTIVELEQQLHGGLRDAPQPGLGLIQLAEAFTALRHEAKLQTKSARALHQEVQNGLTQLDAARVELKTAEENVEKRATDMAEQLVAPLIEALLDIDEALRQARTMRLERASSGDADNALAASLESEFARLPTWRRVMSRFWYQRSSDLVHRFGSRLADSEEQGLRILHASLERALKAGNIECLPCEGQPVDPNTMRVVDTIQDNSRPPETVVQEIRPGYRRNGKLIRHAEVKAVRSES
jgi:molecular chaperone GrpE